MNLLQKNEWVESLFGRLPEDTRNHIAKHWENPPIKVSNLAKELGLSVFTSDMNFNISGQISCENDVYVIRVNRYEPRERQRFTIAHELAHYLLHKDIIDELENGIQDNVLYRSQLPEKIEAEANHFASELLMPSKLLKQKLALVNYDSSELIIEILANQFNVSLEMEVKVKSFL